MELGLSNAAKMIEDLHKTVGLRHVTGLVTMLVCEPGHRNGTYALTPEPERYGPPALLVCDTPVSVEGIHYHKMADWGPLTQPASPETWIVSLRRELHQQQC